MASGLDHAGMKPARRKRLYSQVLEFSSPLRRADPRSKLVLCLGISLAVMLPLERLSVFVIIYILILLWARLLTAAARQVWRIKWVLLLLFLVDWWLVGIDLATTITLRVALLTGIFTLFFSTTTMREFGLALESLHLPYRYAFSLSLAMGSLDVLADEWRTIQEAQTARGIWTAPESLKALIRRLRDMPSLVIPAVILTTKRAWSINEAAYARGFDSPKRRPYQQLRFSIFDLIIITATLIGIGLLFLWR